MDMKKINRIFRFIEQQEGLTTEEHEYLMVTLNRLYIKSIMQQQLNEEKSSNKYAF